MRKMTVASIAMIILGIVLLGYSVYISEAQVYILLIIPVITGGGLAAFCGTMLLFGGIFLFFFSLAGPAMIEPFDPAKAPPQSAAQTGAPQAPRGRFGGVILLGPIPIVFGSDKKIAKWMLAVALVLVILLVIVMWYFSTHQLR